MRLLLATARQRLEATPASAAFRKRVNAELQESVEMGLRLVIGEFAHQVVMGARSHIQVDSAGVTTERTAVPVQYWLPKSQPRMGA